MGGAVPLFAGKASCGWRCAMGIGGEGVLWVALCRCDFAEERAMGSVAPLGLAGRASWGSAVPLRLAGRASCA